MRIAWPNSQGFILPLTLWIIAIIGFASAVLSEWVSEAVSNAQAIQNKTEAELAFANIRNEIIFALARSPFTTRGLEVGESNSGLAGTSFDAIFNADLTTDRIIALDGRPYVISSNTKYAIKIQDSKGLVNLNIVNAPYLARLLSALEVNEDKHSMLVDMLLDYRDEDSLTRLSGAEKTEYLRMGMYPPADFQLMSPWEAQRVIGWSQLPELWNIQYERPLVTTCRSSGFNPNTAPKEVLATYLDGVSMESAGAMIEHREETPFRNARDVGDAAGIILVTQPFFFSFLPGRCFIVDLIDRESNERIRFSLTLRRREREQPWQIDYVLKIPKAYRQSLDQLDPDVTFPSPEEIARGSPGSDNITRL